MAEIGEGFSITELKGMVRVLRDPREMMAMKDTIVQLRKTAMDHPDISWEEFQRASPQSLRHRDEVQLVHTTFDRYKSGRAAVLHWQEKSASDDAGTIQQIKDTLSIPESVQIGQVAWSGDCCVLHLSQEEITKLYVYGQEKHGQPVPEGFQAGGFFEPEYRLYDDQGNYCSVIVVPLSRIQPSETELHEREHAKFARYYERSTPTESDIPPRTEHKEKVVRQIHALEKPISESVAAVCRREVVQILQAHQRLLYNEMLVTGTSGVLRSRNRYFLETITDHFNPSERGRLGHGHPYAQYIRESVDGVLDAIPASFTPDERLKLWSDIEDDVGIFVEQNKQLTRLVQRIWEKSAGDVDEYAAMLYTVPFPRVWELGTFIGEDPKKIRWSLDHIPQEDVRSHATWSMLRRIANDGFSHAFQRECALFETVTAEQLRQSHVGADALSDWDTFMGAVAGILSPYMEKRHALAEQLFQSCTGLYAGLTRIGSGEYREARQIRQLIDTSLAYWFRPFVIRDALVRHLVAIGKPQDTAHADTWFTHLYEGEKGKKNGYGYWIVDEEERWHKEHNLY